MTDKYSIVCDLKTLSEPGIVPTRYEYTYYKLYLTGKNFGKLQEIYPNDKSGTEEYTVVNNFVKYLVDTDSNSFKPEELNQFLPRVLNCAKKSHRVMVVELNGKMYFGNLTANNMLEEIIKSMEETCGGYLENNHFKIYM